jgi:hypothetical protein
MRVSGALIAKSFTLLLAIGNGLNLDQMGPSDSL